MPNDTRSSHTAPSVKGTARSALTTVLGLAVLAPLLSVVRVTRRGRASEHQETRTPDRSEASREAPEVAVPPVLWAVIGVFAFVGLSLLGLRLYYEWDIHGPVVRTPHPFAEPRLQSDPVDDLRRFQAEQRQPLIDYAWVDRGHGLVRIPIDRAMDLIATRGVDAYAPLDPPADPSPIRAPEKKP